MQLIITENEVLQKEQDRLIELQAKLTQDARKKEQELRKQVGKVSFVEGKYSSTTLSQFKTEIDNIENLYQQRLNESQDSIRNLTIQYEAQSLAFKVMKQNQIRNK